MDSGSRDACLLTSWRDQWSKHLVRWHPDDHLGQTESARVSRDGERALVSYGDGALVAAGCWHPGVRAKWHLICYHTRQPAVVSV